MKKNIIRFNTSDNTPIIKKYIKKSKENSFDNIFEKIKNNKININDLKIINDNYPKNINKPNEKIQVNIDNNSENNKPEKSLFDKIISNNSNLKKTNIDNIETTNENKPNEKIQVNIDNNSKNNKPENSLFDKIISNNSNLKKTNIDNNSKNNKPENSLFDKIISNNSNLKKTNIDNIETTNENKPNEKIQVNIDNNSENNKPKNSLFDKIISNNSNLKKTNIDNIEITNENKPNEKIQVNVDNNKNDKFEKKLVNKELEYLFINKKTLTNSINSEKDNKNNNIKEIITHKNLDKVISNAEKLNLNLKNIEITKEDNKTPKYLENKIVIENLKKTQNTNLNKLIINQQLIQKPNFNTDLKNNNEEIDEIIKIDTTINISKESIEVFNSKIIESKQKENSFMSDLAKKIYENYKPPVTVMKIKLNPGNLGQLTILIKSFKADNILNISIKSDKLKTFENMNEYKKILQVNLSKQFNQSNLINNINLDLSFSSDDDGENKQSGSNSNSSKEEQKARQLFNYKKEQKKSEKP